MTQVVLSIFGTLFIALFLINDAVLSLEFKTPNGEKEKENSFWYAEAEEEIQAALKITKNEKIAKNIIFFLGDGMGITVSTAGRIFKGQKKGFSGEEEYLAWEKFPNVGLVKTYTVDKQVTDSASAATAYLGGVKANFKTIGVNGNVAWKDCNASLILNNKVDSILKWSQDSGKETGYITTTRLTHATPAGLYANVASRDWECDADMIKDIGESNCKDIARQLVEDLPGRKINVILAGGRHPMGASLPSDGKSSCRQDKRNLAKEWLADKEAAGNSSVYVTNNKEFQQIDVEKEDYILGLFSGSHMPCTYYRDARPEGTPSIKELTEVAIKRLKRSSDGFFLLVEGGRIDTALHDTKPRLALEDLVDFDEAVNVALNLTNSDDTLIIVTADHSHVMTLNGYPDRGNDILGTTTYEDVTDGLPYTTLMFTNGPGYNYTWNGKEVVRRNLTGVDTRDPEFISQAAIPTLLGSETHGGEDVSVFASGPMSHLFHSLHEQSYIAHAMAYASCVGPFKLKCDKQKRTEKPSQYLWKKLNPLKYIKSIN